ncbi:pyridoxamine 5'-phosphate oxidase family protein [Agrobacterium cavarae]|uniref:pyridoxamine 5'-phosphate oxidase family protein n=1 Tax=Agrobacterium cavarae TaxID=2528239 RepID=UPI0013AEB103|nr:pyridoxamine 5'-phosphate oxidase family protein [Agrobacterium cavarae]
MSNHRHLHGDPDEVIRRIWSALEGGTKSRAPFNLLQVATVAHDGKPSVRTIVLRQFRRGPGELFFVTDAGSAKMSELRFNNHVSLVGYDPATWTQIRLSGQASVSHDEDERLAQWKMLSSRIQRSFLPRAGNLSAEDQRSGEATIPGTQQPVVPPADFALVRVTLFTAELLDVSEEEHLQYNFNRADGTWSGDRSGA